MIDLHTHILPGLDHGPGDWDEALEMCRIAVADGITAIAATPHVSEVFPNSPQRIEAAAADLRRRLADNGIPLTVHVGGDYHIRPDLAPPNVLTLGGNGRYFLLEFPYQILPPRADAFIKTLLDRGLLPIVTHPERTTSLQRDWRRLEPLVKAGALVQVTAGSLLGEFGPAATAAASRFLKKGWVHLLASDAHWVHERSLRLAEGCAAAARIVGESAARVLVDQNPGAILEGRDLPGS
ncbi:MAG: tyrosine-protein phosphatase [Candidatus Methylomirabilia bacterium]